MRRLLVFLLAAAGPLFSHVGSPDVFYEGAAGPYRLLVTIRPPQVVPGVAEIEILSTSGDAGSIRVAPLRFMAGKRFSPVPDILQRSKQDPNFFTGSVWLMSTGSWKVLIEVEGAAGRGELAVPVPALSTRVLGMQMGLALVLIPLGLVLAVGAASIVAASVREAQLPPGELPSPQRVRRSRTILRATLAGLSLVLWLGNTWWKAEAGDYSRIVYKPLEFRPEVQGDVLRLRLKDPGWLNRRVDDLLPDHGHLMHLYVVRKPDMDQAWHLHPEPDGESDSFTQNLPAMAAGEFALYGDIVHANGLAETATGSLTLPAALQGRPLTGDDAASDTPTAYRLVWEKTAPRIRARQPYEYRFRLVDGQGQDARDVEFYMGMPGHAAFVKRDGTVFAHVHPSGSVPAAAMGLANPENPHVMHMMGAATLPAQVTFPYGLPTAGAYRLFVQMKHGGEIVTGMFNIDVEN